MNTFFIPLSCPPKESVEKRGYLLLAYKKINSGGNQGVQRIIVSTLFQKSNCKNLGELVGLKKIDPDSIVLKIDTVCVRLNGWGYLTEEEKEDFWRGYNSSDPRDNNF